MLHPRVKMLGVSKFASSCTTTGLTGLRYASNTGRFVLGCGSNVVDHIYNVKVVPKAGEKGFFLSPFKALEAKLIGGVTLNHLSWAALGGVPSGLLALQGNDEEGKFIRSKLQNMGVTTQFIKANEVYSTAQCHVFIEESGERAIYMAPAASSLINAEIARESFCDAISTNASMVTTEISQIPFTGVLELLKMAKEAGVMSVLDLDVPPSVAIDEAKLGNMDNLQQCLHAADIIKPAKGAANELLTVLGMQKSDNLNDVALKLLEQYNSKMVALTDGSAGSIIATKEHGVVQINPLRVDRVVDTTGAGDAFLGGLIVGLSKFGFPTDVATMKEIGTIANAFGATCIQSVGGVPVASSRKLLENYLPEISIECSSGVANQFKEFRNSLLRDSEGSLALAQSFSTPSNAMATFMTALEECQGQVYTSGTGKSGHVAARLAGTLSSVGITAHYVSATEWAHGDLGKLQPGKDVCVFISHSGSTQETVTAASQVLGKGVTTLGISKHQESPLSKLCVGGYLNYEACDDREPFGCLPSTTLVIQEILCNAVACELISRRGIEERVFRDNHPGGAIGYKTHNL